jgi:hypothetical protein
MEPKKKATAIGVGAAWLAGISCPHGHYTQAQVEEAEAFVSRNRPYTLTGETPADSARRFHNETMDVLGLWHGRAWFAESYDHMGPSLAIRIIVEHDRHRRTMECYTCHRCNAVIPLDEFTIWVLFTDGPDGPVVGREPHCGACANIVLPDREPVPSDPDELAALKAALKAIGARDDINTGKSLMLSSKPITRI